MVAPVPELLRGAWKRASIVNADGSIAWKEPYTATLALITQPTLTGD